MRLPSLWEKLVEAAAVFVVDVDFQFGSSSDQEPPVSGLSLHKEEMNKCM